MGICNTKTAQNTSKEYIRLHQALNNQNGTLVVQNKTLEKNDQNKEVQNIQEVNLNWQAVETELTLEERRHIIDISRPPKDFILLNEFKKLQARLKGPNGLEYKNIKIEKGLEYTKEYPDYALRYNTDVVFHNEQIGLSQNSSTQPRLIMPKIFEHPDKVKNKYSHRLLVTSVNKIIMAYANDQQRVNQIMQKIKKQVQNGLDSINLFRSIHENERNYIHTHCLAIAFYLDHYDQEKDFNESVKTSHLLSFIPQTYEFDNSSNDFIHQLSKSKDEVIMCERVLRECKKEIDQVVYWVNRAIVSCNKYKGQCVRKVYFKNLDHLKYFQVGKVFRFQNIISAWIQTGPDDSMPKYSKDRNVTFYINSVNGVQIYDYLGNRSFEEQQTGRTVLFPSGSEFLICKVEKVGQMTNIYLRNITLGLSHGQTILWTDESSGTHKFSQMERMLNYRIRYMKQQQDFSLVLKQMTLTTKGYLESPFFFIALSIGHQFVFVQNTERPNEIFLRFNGEDPYPKDLAGVGLLQFFYDCTSNMNNKKFFTKIHPIFYKFQAEPDQETIDIKDKTFADFEDYWTKKDSEQGNKTNQNQGKEKLKNCDKMKRQLECIGSKDFEKIQKYLIKSGQIIDENQFKLHISYDTKGLKPFMWR